MKHESKKGVGGEGRTRARRAAIHGAQGGSTGAGRRLCADHLAFARRASAAQFVARCGVALHSGGSRRALFDEFVSKYEAGRMLRVSEGAFVYNTPGGSLSNVYLRWLAFVQLFLSYPQAGAAHAARVMEMKPLALWQARVERITAGNDATRDAASGGDARATRAHRVGLRRIADERGERATIRVTTPLAFERRSTARELAYAANRMQRADAGAFVYKSLGSVLSRVYLKWLSSVQIFFPSASPGESKASTQSLAHAIETKSFIFLPAAGDEAATDRRFAADAHATADAPRAVHAAAEARQRDAGAHATRFVTLRRLAPGIDFDDALHTLARRLDAPDRSRARASSTTQGVAGDATRATRSDVLIERMPAENPYTPPLARREIFVAASPRFAPAGERARLEADAPRRHGTTDLHWLMQRLSELDARAEANRRVETAATSRTHAERDGRTGEADAHVAATRSEAWSLDRSERTGTFMLSLNGFKFLSRHEAARGVVAGADEATPGDAHGRFARDFSAPFVRPAPTQRGEASRDAATARALRRAVVRDASRGAASRAESDVWVYAGRPAGRDAGRVPERNDGGAFARALDIFRRNFAPSHVASATTGATQRSSHVEFEFRPAIALPLVIDRAGATLTTLAERAARRASGVPAFLLQARGATGDAHVGDASAGDAARHAHGSGAHVGDARANLDATSPANLAGTRTLASLVLRGSRLSEKISEAWSRVPSVAQQGLTAAAGGKAAGLFVVVPGGARVSGAGRSSRVFVGGVMDAVGSSFETAEASMPLVVRALEARGAREFAEAAEGNFEGIARTLVALRTESPLRPPRTSYVFAQAQRPATSEPPPTPQSKRAEQEKMVEMVKREVQESVGRSAPPVRFSRADYTSIADQVYSALMRRLTVERERLGLNVR